MVPQEFRNGPRSNACARLSGPVVDGREGELRLPLPGLRISDCMPKPAAGGAGQSGRGRWGVRARSLDGWGDEDAVGADEGEVVVDAPEGVCVCDIGEAAPVRVVCYRHPDPARDHDPHRPFVGRPGFDDAASSEVEERLGALRPVAPKLAEERAAPRPYSNPVFRGTQHRSANTSCAFQ